MTHVAVWSNVRVQKGTWKVLLAVSILAGIPWEGRTEDRHSLDLARGVHFAALSFTPDSKYLLAADNNAHVISVIHLESGNLCKTLDGPEWISDLLLSPNGGLLAVRSPACERVLLWRTSDWGPLPSLPAITRAQGLSFSPDGKTLLGYCGGNAFAIWDVSTQEELRRVSPDAPISVPPSFLPNGNCIIPTLQNERDASLLLWDVQADKTTAKIQLPSCVIIYVTPLPDGIRLAMATQNPMMALPRTTVSIWNVAKGEKGRTLMEHPGRVRIIPLPNDALLTVTSDDTFSWWDLRTSKEIHRVAVNGDVHPSGISIHPCVTVLAVSANGEYIAYRTISDRKYKLWKTSEFVKETKR